MSLIWQDLKSRISPKEIARDVLIQSVIVNFESDSTSKTSSDEDGHREEEEEGKQEEELAHSLE